MSERERDGHVLLGVSGGIAAYKAAEVLRGFQRAGFSVHACLTESATRFVGPLTFAALSGHSVSHGGLGGENDADMAHVELTRDAALFVVAPATANVLGKLAAGIADDWLTTHYLANEAPVLLAPAMNQRMWRHPAVQRNLRVLQERGDVVIPPEEGDLACGEEGPGRLAEPERIVAEGLRLLRSRSNALSGRRVLVTSGPTHEAVDLVRFIGNMSSGQMGHAIAAEAVARGAAVTLVSGPVALPPPAGCDVVAVRTAEEMAEAVAGVLPSMDLAVFAAAVADFRPEAPVDEKLRRGERESWTLELVRTRDVLGEAVAAATGALLVGFAAETGDVVAAGRRKLEEKGCDYLVANAIDGPRPAIGSPENEVHLLGPDGVHVHVPLAAKRFVAARLLDELGPRLRPRLRPADAGETGA